MLAREDKVRKAQTAEPECPLLAPFLPLHRKRVTVVCLGFPHWRQWHMLPQSASWTGQALNATGLSFPSAGDPPRDTLRLAVRLGLHPYFICSFFF